MVQSMKAIGKMTYNTVMVLRLGLMGHVTKDTIRMVKNMEKEVMSGVMDPATQGTGTIIKSMVLVSTHG